MGMYHLLLWSLTVQCAAATSTDRSGPAVHVINPTRSGAAISVEIPIGRLATPGQVDWSQVHLECDGETVPHALRRSGATGPTASDDAPHGGRADDLLVFTCAVPPGQAADVRVVPGAAPAASTLQHEAGKLTASAGESRVVIDPQTATLVSWEAGGVPLLARPLSVTAARLADPGYTWEGNLSIGYTTAAIHLHKDAVAPIAVRLAEARSTPALTELSFILDVAAGPSATLTYRLYASGQLDVVCQERPWEGTSPWLKCALEYTLDFAGQSHEPLPTLENRWAFYGFRDYTATVKSMAQVHQQAAAGVLELGEEFVNGRHFARRLTPLTSESLSRPEDLAELIDEGFVIDVQPLTSGPLPDAVQLVDTTDSPAVAAELTKALAAADVAMAGAADRMEVRLSLISAAAESGIAGDGFAIDLADGGVAVRARTRLGLYSAARAVARHLQRHGRAGGIPLTARNPVVDLRGGGFGGGNFEVDFPYGTEPEWYRVLDNLLDSGMNVFACMGMWANWKMPVSYRLMPELRSDDVCRTLPRGDVSGQRQDPLLHTSEVPPVRPGIPPGAGRDVSSGWNVPGAG